MLPSHSFPLLLHFPFANLQISLKFIPFPLLLLLLLIASPHVSVQQINLGSFSLQRHPFTGDLQLGLGQGANILGFGADRQLGLNLGPGRFGAKSDDGLLLGGHRFGLDSHLGYQEGQGLDLGSFLNLFQPVGQLLNGLGRSPPSAPISPPAPAPRPPPSWPNLPQAGTNAQSVVVQPPPAMPNLGANSAPNWLAKGGEGSAEQFPPSLGQGWTSGENEGGVGGGLDPFEQSSRGRAPPAAATSGGELPWSVGRPPAGRGRVTTEGQFRNGGGGGGGGGIGPADGIDADKHDGETGEWERGGEKPRKGLPIPNGLEPLKM